MKIDQYPFYKMHGLGNDFVIFDCRQHDIALSKRAIGHIAHRQKGIGCNQVIVIRPPHSDQALAFIHIYNADGSEISACGNASRCIAWLLNQEIKSQSLLLETKAGMLKSWFREDGQVSVDMGPVQTDWQAIPLAHACDSLTLPLLYDSLPGVGVNVGNPHAVFFVDDLESVPLAEIGPDFECHPLFPEKANIEFAQILDRQTIRMRVWERGVGITLACGTGACATLIAAARRNLTERKAKIILDGGDLWIEWDSQNHVIMTGPVSFSFTGSLPKSVLL